jgi:sialate O-acetylesterase
VEAWIDQESLKNFEGMKIVNELPKRGKNKSPSLLYNGMLHPFVPFTIKGILWFQGESNVSKAADYQKLFSKMISSWREEWNQKELPFYFVQIAPFGYKGSNSAYLREAQMLTMQNMNNTGMVVTMDIGECKDVHPPEKKLIGNRLAYWALAKNYNIKGIAFSGPIYKSMKIDSVGNIILSFNSNSNGLTAQGKSLTGFKIAGKDKIFHEAIAKINGDSTISVASDSVKKPTAVRYAFDNCAKATLYNTQGLPASSFRTDDWAKE